MLKRTVLRSAAILMILAYTPALEAKKFDALPFGDDFLCYSTRAKTFSAKIGESVENFGKKVRSFPKKHPIAFATLLAVGTSGLSILITSLVHAIQIDTLRQETIEINNMLVAHTVDSYNAQSEMLLELNNDGALLKQLLWDVSQLNTNSYTTAPTVTLVP